MKSRQQKKPVVRIRSRHELVQRITRQIERRGYPRLQMMLLVALTGGAGFLASFVMLMNGIDSLVWRYPMAVGIAYVVFLLLLWLWLRTTHDDYVDISSDIAELLPDAAGEAAENYSGGGGNFGGGGASSQWSSTSSEPLVELPELPDVPAPDVSAAADADELAIPLILIVIIAGILLTVLLASASIVYSAPVLFAEIVLDGVLSASLYRRLRRIGAQRWWVHSAIRRTILPFAITAALLAVGGYAMSQYAPDARSVGEVIEHARMKERG